MPNVNIELDQDEYERLGDLKDTHGFTWRGLLLQGAKTLSQEPPSGPNPWSQRVSLNDEGGWVIDEDGNYLAFYVDDTRQGVVRYADVKDESATPS